MGIVSDEVPPLSKRQMLILAGGAVGVLLGIALVILICIVATEVDDSPDPPSPEEIVEEALKRQLIIDGNNKFPWSLRKLVQNDLSKVNFSTELNQSPPWSGNSQTDLPRLRTGRVGAVLWSAYVECASQNKDAVMQSLEQVDVIKRLVQQYSTDMQLAKTAQEIEDAIVSGKIGSVIALGGGHSIQSSLANLRQFYELGVRTLQLTDDCDTPWAGAAKSDSTYGLTEFGHIVIEEMNRLGMIVDLSRSAPATASSAIIASTAPVIFSSSGAYALCAHEQNVDDEILKLAKEYNGIIMVGADVHKTLCKGPNETTVEDVAEHIDYIRNLTSIDNVGIGGGFDGKDQPADGINDPSYYPELFLRLAETGRWTVEDLVQLAGGNLLRVFRAVEQVRDTFQNRGPIQKMISLAEIVSHNVSLECMAANYTDDNAKSRMQRRYRWTLT